MKTLLQINVVINKGSTGRIAEEIGQKAIAAGLQSYIAYGRDDRPSQSNKIRIGTDWDMRLHGLQTRVLDNHSLGLSSRGATQKLIKQIDEIKPDIIHLHNLHGYYINIEVLFDYLATKDIPIVWTLHDCWAFTGHCCHFSLIGCDKWKSHCYECPLKTNYPASFLIDRSKKNFDDKRRRFNSVKNTTLVPVSNWLGDLLSESFLKDHSKHVINNGIDLDVFKPASEDRLKVKYNTNDKFVMIGVATSWGDSKGLSDYKELSNHLKEDEILILIGLSKKQIEELPNNIIGVERTENLNELVEFYNLADVVLNISYQESFGMTTVEGFACGTPSIVYNATASPELLTDDVGLIVEPGDIKGLVDAIAEIKSNGKKYYSEECIKRAHTLYNKDDRYQEYLELYERLLEGK